MIKNRFAKVLMLIFFSILTSACYWHLRNPGDVPPQLKVMSLDLDNVDPRFKLQLVNLMRSMEIISPPPSQAPLILHAYAYSLQHNNPGVSSTNVAITYSYVLMITLSVTDNTGKIIVPPHVITASRDITINVNQIFTINSTSVFQEELQREAINLIYYWLTSDQTRNYLIASMRQTTHAIPSPAAQTTSQK
jgi:outer membrane lipopolysaccharide assembly protein LptE/RlpB